MKNIIFFLLISPFISHCQEYVDVLKLGYSYSNKAKFKGIDEILEEEATKGNLFKVNTAGGSPSGATKFGEKPKATEDNGVPRRKIAERL